MANILENTENFGASVWAITSDPAPVVTLNTHAAPAFAGGLAGMADTIDDQSAAVQGFIRNETYPGGVTTATDYCFSIYIRKTTGATTVFPTFAVQFLTGGSVFGGISIDTQDSAGAVSTGNVSQGISSIDATWWRAWFVINSGPCTDFRPFLVPAASDALGGSDDGTLQGSIVVWGINVTPSSTLQAYEPSPAYAAIVLTGTAVGGITEADIVAGNRTIICTLTGSTYIP